MSYDAAMRVGNYVFSPATATWSILNKFTGAVRTQQHGNPGDIPVAADYDGDGIADLAVWRPSTAFWYILSSKTNAPIPPRSWGQAGDIPVPHDYDSDGKTDIAIWRPATGVWWVIGSRTNAQLPNRKWGGPGDVPVQGFYDSDSLVDLAVWRPSNTNWYVWSSKTNASIPPQQWGQLGDVPVPGAYDGDGRTDYAVWRPVNGTWYVINSSGRGLGSQDGVTSLRQWGEQGDVPVPATTIRVPMGTGFRAHRVPALHRRLVGAGYEDRTGVEEAILDGAGRRPGALIAG